MHVLGWGPTECWLRLCRLWELSLNWAWETQQPWGQETFPRKAKCQAPAQHGVEGLWPPPMITTFSHHGSCAPVPILVGSLLRNHTHASLPMDPLKDQAGRCDVWREGGAVL